MARTSVTHPLRIDEIGVAGGVIGLTFCPGKRQTVSVTGGWHRDLQCDIAAIVCWGASAVVCLCEQSELVELQVTTLQDGVERAGIRWFHLPIRDGGVPDAGWQTAWQQASIDMHSALVAGARILIHCRGGLGRTGTVASMLLIEAGIDANTAMRMVREARPGAIENAVQEQYISRWTIR